MILFLTICYCGFLWVLVKLRVLKPTLWVKLSPIIWVVLLLFVLFIPLQWAAPAGNVVVWQPVTQMSMRVSGRVSKVYVKGYQHVTKGSPLIEVDPEPYQIEVRRLEAALAQAEQNVPQLKAAWEAAEAASSLAQAQVTLAQKELDRNRELLAAAAISQQHFDIKFRDLQTAEDSLKQAKAQADKARLAYESNTAEGENTTVAQLKAELAKAKWNLNETTLYAPADGRIVNLQLQVGSAIAVAAKGAMVAFVPDAEKYVIASILENFLRDVKSGQEAEVAIAYYPGRILRGTVTEVALITGEGEAAPSGILPKVASLIQTGGRFAVKIKLDGESAKLDLPVGSGGSAAIYTDRLRGTHLIRRVMVRMETWLNYIF